MMSLSDADDFSRSASSRARNSSRSFVCVNSFTIDSPFPVPDSSIFIFKRSASRRRFSCTLRSSESAPAGIGSSSHERIEVPMSATPSRTSSSKRRRNSDRLPRAVLNIPSFPCASRTDASSATRSRSIVSPASRTSAILRRKLSSSPASASSSSCTRRSEADSAVTCCRASSLVTGAVLESPSMNEAIRLRMSTSFRLMLPMSPSRSSSVKKPSSSRMKPRTCGTGTSVSTVTLFASKAPSARPSSRANRSFSRRAS